MRVEPFPSGLRIRISSCDDSIDDAHTARSKGVGEVISVARWKLFVTGGALLILGVWAGRADVSASPTQYPAVVLCEHMAEDAAAHVKLVSYGDGQIVYRCMKNGY